MDQSHLCHSPEVPQRELAAREGALQWPHAILLHRDLPFLTLISHGWLCICSVGYNVPPFFGCGTVALSGAGTTGEARCVQTWDPWGSVHESCFLKLDSWALLALCRVIPLQ